MLTTDERAAFDFAGGRYVAGDVCDLLCQCLPDDTEWSAHEDITFDIPEHVAWQINDLARSERFAWPCFSDELRDKMNDFLAEIV